jgi:hypothetical protein
MVEPLKKRAKRYLADAPTEYVFRCFNGQIPGNLKELETELRSVSEKDYAYHLNARKNNFSNRVRDILKHNSLARTLLKSSTPIHAANYVIAGMSDLSKHVSC